MTDRRTNQPPDQPGDEGAALLAEEESAKANAECLRKVQLSERMAAAARLHRLASLGLPVPRRDPDRRLTDSQSKCGKKWMAGFSIGTGRPVKCPSYCDTWGCAGGCPAYKSELILDRARKWVRNFVGNSPITNGPGIREKADKLWVWMIPTSEMDLARLCELVGRRIERLSQAVGVPVEWVRVPCDDMTLFVATQDLLHTRASGARTGRPRYRLGVATWVASDDAFAYLEQVFLSRSIRDRKHVKWSDNWKPEPRPVRLTELIRGTPAQIHLAWKYVNDSGYRYIVGDPWCADPVSVLQDAIAQADKFLANQVCAECTTPLQYLIDVWCKDGEFVCRVCDLVAALTAFLHRGRTQREIEWFLRDRKMTFKRNGPRLRAALKEAGARQLGSGVWVIESEPHQVEVSK